MLLNLFGQIAIQLEKISIFEILHEMEEWGPKMWLRGSQHGKGSASGSLNLPRPTTFRRVRTFSYFGHLHISPWSPWYSSPPLLQMVVATNNIPTHTHTFLQVGHKLEIFKTHDCFVVVLVLCFKWRPPSSHWYKFQPLLPHLDLVEPHIRDCRIRTEKNKTSLAPISS